MIRGELGFLLRGLLGVGLLLSLLLLAVYGRGLPATLHILLVRSPQLLLGTPGPDGTTGGFAANILISLAAMVVAMCGGGALGAGLVSTSRLVRPVCVLVMNLLRNSPWLVILYAMVFLLPFEFTVGGRTVAFSPFLKAVAGLSLPVGANFAEIVRGGIESVPSGQWEAARSLGYRRRAILRRVIVPQALPLMLPNVMSLFAALFIGSSLVVVTGTSDVLSVAKTVIATDGDRVATAVYIYVLALFFVVSFPIAVSSRYFEMRLQARP